MKKIYTFSITSLIICLCNLKSNATVITVNVEDFQFSPSDFTINLGDTVKWMWDNSAGAHTTTSTNIPPGAVAWNQQINQSAQTFTYVPTIGGSYNYHCSIHSGMIGHFTVIASAGIQIIQPTTSMSLIGINSSTNELKLIYNISETSELQIRMYDILGNVLCTFFSSAQNAGTYTPTFIIPNFAKGIYVINLETKNSIISRKVSLN
jgi:plastocyanin